MKNGKDTKPVEAKNTEPEISGFSYDEFFQNRLALPQAVKDYLAKKGLDYRFLNANEYRRHGNTHRSHWKPFEAPEELSSAIDLTVDRHIQRGDLILGVRPKQISAAHRKFLTERNRRYSGYNKDKAQEIRDMAREAGASQQVKVYEGYEENDTE